MALSRPRGGDGVPRVRLAEGELPYAWPDGRPGSLGTPCRRAHAQLRRPGGLARHAYLEVGGLRAHADRLAQRRSIVTRVVADGRAAKDPFDGLVRIGLDEMSYKRGHRYLIVAVDHDSGRLIWAAAGRDKKTLREFFDLLGPERCAAIRLVSADAAEWIGTVVAESCENATLCIDAFHVVQWATEALDKVRRDVWNTARRAGMNEHARELKGCRYALWKNPEDLTARQTAKLAFIARVNSPLYRAYLMKEQLRQAIRVKGVLSLTMLDDWLSWAQRSRIPAFVELGRKIKKNLPGIEAAMLNKLSNAIVESTNTKLRVLTRMAYGFKEPEHLIALALLDRGGYCPPLPGRIS